jgi:hypothetical protein
MAEEPDTTEPGDDDESKLELPSLSFRRRRKTDQPVEEPPAETVAETSVEAEAPPPAEEPAEEPEPVTEPVDHPVDEPDEDEHTQVLPSAPEAAAREPEAEPKRASKPATVPQERATFRLPATSAPIASVLTGVVVGLVMVGLTFLSSRGCELVRGTPKCGGVGLLLLVAILVVGVLLGAVLLKAWQVSDPLNSSFLAVGLVAVVAMLFLLPSITEWWMVIVIPVLGAATYVLAWWVTRTFVDTEDDAEEPEDAGIRGL